MQPISNRNVQNQYHRTVANQENVAPVILPRIESTFQRPRLYGNIECKPDKIRAATRRRSLGRITVYPSAFLCPWLENTVTGEINTDGTTLHTDDGDTFESVLHWVQAEHRRHTASYYQATAAREAAMWKARDDNLASDAGADQDQEQEQEQEYQFRSSDYEQKNNDNDDEEEEEEEEEDDLYNFDNLSFSGESKTTNRVEYKSKYYRQDENQQPAAGGYESKCDDSNFQENRNPFGESSPTKKAEDHDDIVYVASPVLGDKDSSPHKWRREQGVLEENHSEPIIISA